MHRILVTEQSPSINQDHEGCWWVNVWYDGALIHEALKINDPFQEKDEADCRWYLEKYTVEDSFEREKASVVARALQEYGKKIFGELHLSEIVALWAKDSLREVKLDIDIIERGYSTESMVTPLKTIHRLHWEALEAVELWGSVVTQVSVKRRASHTDVATGIKHITSWPSQSCSKPDKTLFNVLLVVSRKLIKDDAEHQDADPTHALRVLLGIQSYLTESEAPYALNVEVVRPGTLAALKKHLEVTETRHGPGYFRLVHFDMHGFIGKGKGDGIHSAYLKFADPKDPKEYVPVRSSVIARLLQKHRISVAVLGACDSARSNKGIQANLAKTLVLEGLSNVLAMSYKFGSNASKLFFGAFYQSFFIGKATFAGAVSAGRQYLKSHPLRDARFSQKVELADWLVPVTYTNGEDVKVLSPIHGTSAQPSSGELEWNGLPAHQIQWNTIGRDYDKLRFEDQLLRTKVVYLHGPAGCGKTEMMTDLGREWKQTGFAKHVVHLLFNRPDLTAILHSIELALDEEDFPTSPTLDGAVNPDSIISRLHQHPSVLILELSHIFNEPIEEYYESQVSGSFHRFKRDFLSFVQAVINPSPTDSVRAPYVVLIGRRNEGWLKRYFPDLKASSYGLEGLGLPGAIALSERILQSHGLEVLQETREGDTLIHIVNMLQRLPRALELIMPKIPPKSSLDSFFTQLLDGHVTISLDEYNTTLSNGGPDFFLATLDSCLQPEIGDPDLLLCFSHFWNEGPDNVLQYVQKVRQASLSSDTKNLGTSAIHAVHEFGGWTIDQDSMDWIHPLWTLYLRGRQQQNASWHTCEKTRGLREQFIKAVEGHFMSRFLQGGIAGQSAPGFCKAQRPSLFNVVLSLKFCSDKIDLMPTKHWPVAMFAAYGPPSRLSFSIPEQALLAVDMEILLKLFLQRKNTYAFRSEELSGPLSLTLHLAAVHSIELVTTPCRGPEFVEIALHLIGASEKQFGPLSKGNLNFKGLAFRFKAKELLEEGNALEALAFMKNSNGIDGELFGNSDSKVGPATAGTPGDRKPALKPGPRASENVSDFLEGNHARLESYAKARHPAIDELTTQIESKIPLQDISFSKSGVQQMTEGLSGVLKAHEETGQAGLDHWKRWFPRNQDSKVKEIDMAYHMQRLTDPKYRLEELATATESGDWANAIQHHQALLANAAKNFNPHQMARHADEIDRLYRETTAPDPSTAAKLKATKVLSEALAKMFDSMQLGNESDLVPLASFEEAVMPSLRVIKGDKFAEGFSSLFRCYTPGRQVSEHKLMVEMMNLSRELFGDRFADSWKQNLDTLGARAGQELPFLERLRSAMAEEFGA